MGDVLLPEKGRRDRLFFVVYAGLLVFGFFWMTLPHVRVRVTDVGLLRGIFAGGLCYLAIRASLVLPRTVSDRWEPLWVAVDLALISSLVYLTGGINSEAGLIYILPIFTYSIQRRVIGTFAVGMVSVALYIGATLPGDPGLDYFGRVTTRIVILALVTLLATCYAAHERARVRERERLRARVALGEYRRELSAEIHDGIQHYLVSAAMRLEMARSIAEADPRQAAEMAVDQRHVLRQASDELRYLIRRLRAPSLQQLGFVEALREHVEIFCDRSDFDVTLEVEGASARLAPDAEHAAFRIVQEALTNIEKHAQASAVRITLTWEGGTLECAIDDDGVGFDLLELPDEPDVTGGFGLATMRQRAEQAGGELQINTAPGEGSCIRVVVPIRSASDNPPE